MTQSPSISSSRQLKYFSPLAIRRKGLIRLDFLLVLIETIEINGVYSMVQTSKNIELENGFTNSVDLWKARAHNPLRRASRRGKISDTNINSLITLISKTADRLYPLLRQLLSGKEPSNLSQERWELLNTRFNELIYDRMNLKRVVIQKMLNKDDSFTLLRELVLLLALSSGPEGINRLRTSINDLN